MKQLASITEQILKDIRTFISIGVTGRTCIGSEVITLSNASVSTLNIPAGAVTAEITLESAAATPLSTGARYSLSTTAPATGATPTVSGIPIGDGDTVEIVGGSNLMAFKVINVNTDTRALKIQYFK